MEICEGPDCRTDLTPLKESGQLRPHAKVCSGTCRAAKSRAAKPDDAAAFRRFERGLGAARTTRLETPARRRARAKGLTGRMHAPGPFE